MCAAIAYTLAHLIPLATFNAPQWLVGFGLIAATTFVLPAVISFMKHKATVSPLSPDGATTLVTHGVLGVTRHPMYVGMLLALLGFALWLVAVSAIAMVGVFFVLIDRYQIAIEEQSLLNIFGEAYRDYAARVPRWLFIRQGVEQ